MIEPPNQTPAEQPASQPQKERSTLAMVLTVLVAAWLIGMSIIGAGWLISKEISKQTLTGTEEKPPVRIDLPIPDDKPTLGSSNAKVTLVEFADFQCPFCAEWQNLIFPRLKSEYIDTGKVRFVYWDFPFLGDESTKSSEAGLCAKDQNKFWEFHGYLFSKQDGENEGAFNDANLKKFAQETSLDTATFNKCFDARTYQAVVDDSFNTASSYGVNSTPTIYINGWKFEGMMPYENYKQVIESELAI